MASLGEVSGCLDPAKAFFDAFAQALTDGIARMASDAPVDSGRPGPAGDADVAIIKALRFSISRCPMKHRRLLWPLALR